MSLKQSCLFGRCNDDTVLPVDDMIVVCVDLINIIKLFQFQFDFRRLQMAAA